MNMCMTVQKEIQNTPIDFKRVTLDEEVELHSVFKEDSRRQLFHQDQPIIVTKKNTDIGGLYSSQESKGDNEITCFAELLLSSCEGAVNSMESDGSVTAFDSFPSDSVLMS